MRHHLSLLLLGFVVPAVASAGVPDRVRDYEAAYTLADYTHLIPSFSRQTGLACNVCHTAFPMLTAFGRQFKLNGYTLTGLQVIGGEQNPQLKINLIPPVSTMLQTSLTQVSKARPGTQNGNVEFPQQLSVFFGEAISPRMGTFIQITYDAMAGSVGIDNIDLRYANHGKLASKPVLYGFTLNNSPTVQDVWNTTPVWGYPFGSSAVAPTPAASPIINEGLAQTVAGFGGYALWNEHIYGELSVYKSAPQGGAHPPDSTSELITKGVTPYWRLAYQQNFGKRYLELGTFGLSSSLYPTGVTGPTDRYDDVGADVQLEQRVGKGGGGNFVLHASYIHEHQKLDATFAGGASNAKNDLNTVRADAAWLTASRWGGTIGAFATSGTADTLLYAPGDVTGSATGKPNSSGYIAELQYMPWINTRFSMQYVGYSKFNGASTNYDGAGRKASDNNTLYVLVWLMF